MNPKKILIAVDASENALRAVEYTGEIVGNSEEFHIELLTIERFSDRDLFATDEEWKEKCGEQQQAYMDFLAKAKQILIDRGVLEGNIFERYIESCKSPLRSPSHECSIGTNIAQEIMNTIKEEGFGTVVIGRRGVSKEVEFLFGSVSTKIVHYAKGCTVWIVS
ncbi:MAG: universal stress protein [Thermodesulfobacteriota bacterium]|nr:universal stress protein [Thermodesulfobacteriota bacterium]